MVSRISSPIYAELRADSSVASEFLLQPHSVYERAGGEKRQGSEAYPSPSEMLYALPQRKNAE
jgi:hypothetical protein